MPKPMIPLNGRTIIEYSLDSFDISEANVVFIVQKQHILEFSIDSFLKKKYGENIRIIELDELTGGALCTCLFAEKHIDNELPLVIYTPDVTFAPNFNLKEFDKFDAALLTFKANSPDHSYAKIDANGLVVETKEKVVISNNAAVGLYYFKDPKFFFDYGNEMIKLGDKTKNEFFICPIYNYYIRDGHTVGAILSKKLYVLGTPKELEFYERNVLNDNFTIGLCSDHSGYDAKELVAELLDENNIEYIDYGTFSENDCDYNSYVNQSINQLTKNQIKYVFGFCRTGQGINICANKNDNIRGCVIYDLYSCKYAIKHNCCNFFSFPSKGLDKKTFLTYLKTIKENTFDGGRHYNRISKDD